MPFCPRMLTAPVNEPGRPPKVWANPSFAFFTCLGPHLALELLIDLVDHAQSTRPDRVAQAFQAAIRIDRQSAGQFEPA